MMADIQIKEGEELLGRGECSMMLGPLSVIGDLTLTSQRLHFEPNRLNRMMGLKSVTIETSKIKKIDIVGIDRVVTILDNKRTTKFMGKWAKTVSERLKALRDQAARAADSSGFDAGERYLIQTSIDYATSPVVMVGGDITVTTRTVHFEPSGLEKMMWRKLKVQAPVADISDLTLSGPRRVEFRLGEEHHRFSGSAATRIYAALDAAKTHARTGLPSRDLVFDLMSASVERGMLSHPGTLVQLEDCLRFFLGGSLDALVGIAAITDFRWSELERVDVGEDSKLTLTQNGEKHILSVPGLSDHERSFLLAFGRASKDGQPTLGVTTGAASSDEEKAQAAAVSRTLRDVWGERLPDLRDQTLSLWAPSVRTSRRVGCRRGRIGIFDEYVVWVPEGDRASGLNPIVVPIAQLERIGLEQEAGVELRLRLDTSELHLLATEGAQVTQAFWEQVGDRAAELSVRQADRDASSLRSTPDVWNRRATYRVGLPVKLHVPAELRVISETQSLTASARVMNLSLGGAGLASAEAFPIGADILLSVCPEEERDITFRGRVIHSRRVGRRNLIFSGLEFADLSTLEDERLRRLWTSCQRIEVQLSRGVNETTIPPIDGAALFAGRPQEEREESDTEDED